MSSAIHTASGSEGMWRCPSGVGPRHQPSTRHQAQTVWRCPSGVGPRHLLSTQHQSQRVWRLSSGWGPRLLPSTQHQGQSVWRCPSGWGPRHLLSTQHQGQRVWRLSSGVGPTSSAVHTASGSERVEVSIGVGPTSSAVHTASGSERVEVSVGVGPRRLPSTQHQGQRVWRCLSGWAHVVCRPRGIRVRACGGVHRGGPTSSAVHAASGSERVEVSVGVGPRRLPSTQHQGQRVWRLSSGWAHVVCRPRSIRVRACGGVHWGGPTSSAVHAASGSERVEVSIGVGPRRLPSTQSLLNDPCVP
nr:uncharacterized protein LOC127487859 [Oryctolagus cuniculus]